MRLKLKLVIIYNSWESVKELQALCGRLDFRHIYAERKLIFFSKLSISKNIVVQACYNNFRRSREFCVLCCEFDVAIGTCCVGFIKDRMVNSFLLYCCYWQIEYVDFRFFLFFFLILLYCMYVCMYYLRGE